MSFYEEHVLPRLLDLTLRQALFVPYRRRLAGAARGRVLDVGIGSGRTLPFYGATVDLLIGLDPSLRMLGMARQQRDASGAVVLLAGSGEAVPLADRSVDDVITTWTLCSIPDVERALREVHRVLKPGGRFLVVEHGRSPEPRIGNLQDRLTPIWKRFAGGCHLNRPIDQLIEQAGFRIERLDKGYMRPPKFMTFTYEGCARR